MMSDSPLLWDDGAPRSALYGDIYFSLEDGLAEARAVFLQGCGLPDAWNERSRFTVGELGFGSGLNICALLDLWRREGPKGAHLHIFSVEAHPLSRADAARALSAWPEIAAVAEPLLASWPGRRRGFHRVDLPDLSATLDVAVMEVAEALRGWSGCADAWFLDGFSPALNPAMWREEVIGLVAAASAPGARAATFTVAGEVRRRLQAAGFSVDKRPGHGRKRERLEARLPGAALPESAPKRVAVIGGGVAGASLRRAFGALGLDAAVFADGVGASGNPAALVTPAVDAGGGARSAFYAQAFVRAVQLYETIPDAIIARGVVQLEAEGRDASRFDRVADQDHFEPGSLLRLTPEAVAAKLDEPADGGGLLFAAGLVIEPRRVLHAWLGTPRALTVSRIALVAGGVRLHLAEGEVETFEAVVLACGSESARLWPSLSLTPVRGQASFAKGIHPTIASAFGAYAIPTRDGVLFGATHDRGDTGLDVRRSDHARNLQALSARRPNLARSLAQMTLEACVGLRATTPTRMPLAGELAPGLFALTGLGSRGFTTAPVLAEHVAALVAGAPSPLPSVLTEVAAVQP